MGRGNGTTLELDDVERVGLLDHPAASVEQLWEALNECDYRANPFRHDLEVTLRLWELWPTFAEMAAENPQQWRELSRGVAFAGLHTLRRDSSPERWVTEICIDGRFIRNLSRHIVHSQGRRSNPISHLRAEPNDEETLCGQPISDPKRPRTISRFRDRACKRCLATLKKLANPNPELLFLTDFETPIIPLVQQQEMVEQVRSKVAEFLLGPRPATARQLASALDSVALQARAQPLASFGAEALLSLPPDLRFRRLTYPYLNDGGWEADKTIAALRAAMLSTYGSPAGAQFPWPSAEQLNAVLNEIFAGDHFSGSWAREETLLGHFYAQLFPQAVSVVLAAEDRGKLNTDAILGTWRDFYPQLVVQSNNVDDEDIYASLPV